MNFDTANISASKSGANVSTHVFSVTFSAIILKLLNTPIYLIYLILKLLNTAICLIYGKELILKRNTFVYINKMCKQHEICENIN